MIELLSSGNSVFGGFSRWDFLDGCPNKTAVLLVFAAIVSLTAAFRVRWKPGSVFFCALSCVFVCAAAFTFSRGGFVALLVGLTLSALLGGGPSSRRRRWPYVLSVVSVAVIMVFVTGFSSRLAGSLPSLDASVGNRLAIWKHVPRMMADAPGGWGGGNAGSAYMSWYQPVGRHERYRTLVSSPLTFLVEVGWPVRCIAVFGWSLFFFLLIGLCRYARDGLALSIWAAFAVGAFFSTLAESRVLWAVPVSASVFSVAACRGRLLTAVRSRNALRWFGTAAAFAVTVSACFAVIVPHLAGFTSSGLKIARSRDGSTLVAGDGEPERWIVYDASVMGGAAYGKALRSWLKTGDADVSAVGIAASVDDIPQYARRIVICGAAVSPEDAALRFRGKALRVLSPEDPSRWLAVAGLDVRVYCGEFSAHCPEECHPGLDIIVGCGDYLPSWPSLAFGK